MRTKWKRLITLLLAIIMGTAGVYAAPAEESSVETDAKENLPGEKPSQEAALEQIMNSNPEDALEPDFTKPEIPKTSYYKDFEYTEDVLLKGIFTTESYFFKIPDYWECGYAYAQLELTLSQLIQDVPASLTFMVNNVPVYTCKMDYSYGKNQILYVTIPLELLNEGYNSFSVTGYIRLYDEEGCLDDFSGANWVNISKNSFIQTGYDAKPAEKKLSYYPYPFMSTMDADGSDTGVYVSDALNEAELAAAILLRADLGAETESEDQIAFGTIGQDKGRKNVVLVSLTSNMPEAYQSMLSPEEMVGLEDRAGMKFVESGGRNILLIFSDEEDCLMEAAAMLLDESRVDQERSSFAVVPVGSAQLIKNAAAKGDLIIGNYTLDALLDSHGVSFTGPFHQEADIFLPFSGGYVLAESGKITLNFRYSENLDFKRSMITVYWGDIPVASKKLTRENAAGDSLSFVLPADVVGTSATKISIAFDLELPELFCTPRMDEMPWAYVAGDSTLYLPVGDGSKLTFDLKPYPFESSDLYNHLAVVLPENCSPQELDALGQLMTMYGESVSPYGELEVVKAGDFQAEDYKDCNLIILGTYQNNPVIASLNDRLSFQYDENGEVFLSNDHLILSESYASQVVSLQLLVSPYNAKRAILVAGATMPSEMQYLAEYLKKDRNQWAIVQDTALIDSELELRTFQCLTQNIEAKRPGLAQWFSENKSAVIFSVVAGASMLLFLMAAVIITMRYYSGKKKDK